MRTPSTTSRASHSLLNPHVPLSLFHPSSRLTIDSFSYLPHGHRARLPLQLVQNLHFCPGVLVDIQLYDFHHRSSCERGPRIFLVRPRAEGVGHAQLANEVTRDIARGTLHIYLFLSVLMLHSLGNCHLPMRMTPSARPRPHTQVSYTPRSSSFSQLFRPAHAPPGHRSSICSPAHPETALSNGFCAAWPMVYTRTTVGHAVAMK